MGSGANNKVNAIKEMRRLLSEANAKLLFNRNVIKTKRAP